MANKTQKKRTVEYRERRDLTKVCAFWGIVLAGVAMFISFIIAFLGIFDVTAGWLSTIMGVCNIISMVALLIAIAFPAYNYVRGRTRLWKGIYWAALVLYICGIFGIGINIFA